MRAWVIEEHGGPEVFKEVELPTPQPGPGEVRIKVAATSVNPVDYKIRSGAAEALCPPKPAVLHGDVSGVVDKVGDRVENFAVGDKVYGCFSGYGKRRKQGALADYVIATTLTGEFWHAPESIPITDSAALPLVSITAYEGIRKVGIQEKMKVLVYGGTGGVGHIVIQVLKAMGAQVTTTVSSDEKAALAKKLGAQTIINYTTESVNQYKERLTRSIGFDAVFDTVGGPNLPLAIEAVRQNGQIVCIQGRTEIDGSALHTKGISLHLVFMLIPILRGFSSPNEPVRAELLSDAAVLVDEGKLKPLIDDKRFTFDQIGEAHAYAESGKQVGKVLVVHPDHA